jgi:hypothetical protein
MISLVLGLLLPQKGNIGAEIRLVEAKCDLMRNSGLCRACLAKENKAMFGFGILYPLDDVVQKIFPCVSMTAPSYLRIAIFPKEGCSRLLRSILFSSCQTDDRRSWDCQNDAPVSDARLDISIARGFTSFRFWGIAAGAVTATCVGNVSPSLRSWTTVVRRSSTAFEACFPENHMLTMNNERGHDDVPTFTCFVTSGPVNAYDFIKLAHSETC